jgi:hypothetical protein
LSAGLSTWILVNTKAALKKIFEGRETKGVQKQSPDELDRAELPAIEMPDNLKLQLLQCEAPDVEFDKPDPVRDQT